VKVFVQPVDLKENRCHLLHCILTAKFCQNPEGVGGGCKFGAFVFQMKLK